MQQTKKKVAMNGVDGVSKAPSKKAGIVELLKILGLAVVGFVLYAAYAIYSHHFYNLDPKSWTADRFSTNTTFIRKDVAVTYYKRGELHKLLPKNGWLSDQLDGGIHLFRLEDGEEPYPVDASKLGSVRTRTLVDSPCENLNGLTACDGVCYNLDKPPEPSSVQDMFNEESSLRYGAFSIMEREVFDYLDDLTELPGKMEAGRSLEHGFLSNTKFPTLTAAIHSNPFSHSLAVQYVGRKTWVIFSGRDYHSESGFHATAVDVMFPTKGPTADVMTYWAYKSQPGDYLFFPAHFPHVVMTEPGPCFMVNYRKIFPLKQIWTYPIATLQSLWNYVFSSQLMKEEDVGQVGTDGKTHQSVEKEMNRLKRFGIVTQIFKDYHSTVADLLCDDKNADPKTNLDRILGTLVREASEKLP